MAIVLGGALRQLLVVRQIGARIQATTARGLETVSHDARSDLARYSILVPCTTSVGHGSHGALLGTHGAEVVQIGAQSPLAHNIDAEYKSAMRKKRNQVGLVAIR